MAQPTSFMHQHTYVSQFPVTGSLTILKKYEYGYLLKKISLISDLIFFLIKKRFWILFKTIWRKMYRKALLFKKMAMSFRDKHKRLIKKDTNSDIMWRKPSRGLTSITLYMRWLKFSLMTKEWRKKKRRYRPIKPIKYLHIESFRTFCYSGHFYVYLYVLRYK